jgi:hypothetical protein
MKKSYFIFTLFLAVLFNACQVESIEQTNIAQPSFDYTNCAETLMHLCKLFEKLADQELSDSVYYRLQMEVESTYNAIDTGVKQNYYSHDEVLEVADSLGCVI